ncbi:hypothetical protein BOX15_Mlig015782g1 [Macrostomum lignano]|uniref:C2 domain-containing protein n=1 Tax=Macrostomum lignano TaxID=282301 RepID=A0A267FXU7_9PLAT|nr:hypothetical protein BOX15_Mlig015782g1 [Macrostomum lignano]
MALIVSLRSLDGLEGKSDRILKVTFRGNTQTTSPVASSRFQCYFGQQFQWPVGRPIDEADSLEIRAYNYSKILNNRQIGVLRISLQHLAETGSLDLREHLIDANNAPTNVILDCELRYYSPDSRIGDWQQDDFLYPVDGGVLKDGDGSDFNDDEALEAGGHAKDEADWPADARALLANSADDRLSSLQFEDEAASMLSDGASSLGNEMRKTLEVAAVLDPTLHRMEDFQVSVTIVEARQLSGANINPCVEVRIGDQLKRTDTQMSTNSPYYNQYFAFEFRTTKADLMDQVIHIRAVNKGSMMISRLFAGDLIGEFRLDVRTVYSAPDRMFFQKWACLIDPKDALSGPKGYVKCDINVLGKGEKLKVQPKKTKSSDEEDIEANLLLPIGVPIKRQMADISVIIYRAEGLPKMNTDLMASIKQALAGDSKPLADPYVQVSFAGHSAKTKSIKNSYNPHWNEAIIFTELFPPLCNRIRISLFDWDAVYNECIATHFIDLGQIMNNSENGHLPIFGPSWVNLYGTPRNYNYENMFHPKEELNRGMGEGVAYRGRLLMAIKTEIKQAGGVGGGGGSKAGARVVSAAQVPEAVTGRKEDYLLAGILFDAGAIDADIGKKGKLLTFELSIGTHGNHVDGSFDDASDEDSADEASDFSDSAAGEDSDAELEGAQNRRLLAGGTAVAKEKLRGQRHQWCDRRAGRSCRCQHTRTIITCRSWSGSRACTSGLATRITGSECLSPTSWTGCARSLSRESRRRRSWFRGRSAARPAACTTPSGASPAPSRRPRRLSAPSATELAPVRARDSTRGVNWPSAWRWRRRASNPALWRGSFGATAPRRRQTRAAAAHRRCAATCATVAHWQGASGSWPRSRSTRCQTFSCGCWRRTAEAAAVDSGSADGSSSGWRLPDCRPDRCCRLQASTKPAATAVA